MQAVSASVCDRGLSGVDHIGSSDKEKTVNPSAIDSEKYIPEAPSSVRKKLREYSIIVLKLIATIIIVPPACALSVPITLVRLPFETFKNRYLHYRKYHPGTHCLNPAATRRNKEKTCAELKAYCDHIAKNLNKLAESEMTWGTIKISRDPVDADIRNELHILELDLKTKIRQLRRGFLDLYKEEGLRETKPEKNEKTEELLRQVSAAHARLGRVILAIPDDKRGNTSRVGATLANELSTLHRWSQLYQQNIICPHCCPMCVSATAEIMPNSCRAFLFTLKSTLSFPFLLLVGAYRTAELVLFRIWGIGKPMNYFPWHPGEAHRFPFSTSKHKGVEALMPPNVVRKHP